MRLIDADAFILKLREISKECEYTKTTIDKNLTVDDVFEAIISELDGTSLNGFNNAPTVSQWIPVTKRLPEESGLYQVTDMQGNVVRYVFNVNKSSEEYWRRCVKAWMPLPEPYRE